MVAVVLLGSLGRSPRRGDLILLHNSSGKQFALSRPRGGEPLAQRGFTLFGNRSRGSLEGSEGA